MENILLRVQCSRCRLSGQFLLLSGFHIFCGLNLRLGDSQTFCSTIESDFEEGVSGFWATDGLRFFSMT